MRTRPLTWTLFPLGVVVGVAATLAVTSPLVQPPAPADASGSVPSSLVEEGTRPPSSAVGEPDEHPAVRPNPARRASSDPGAEGPVAIPAAILDAAVERELSRRREREREATRRRHTDDAFETIGHLVDAWISDGVLAPVDAGDVEALLQAEVEETWWIKGEVGRGEMLDADGVEAWRRLIRETDDQLDAVVGPEVRAQLREDLEGKD